MRLAAVLACAIALLLLPSTTHAAGWAFAEHQPPAGDQIVVAPDGRAWTAWELDGGVWVSRREPGRAWGAPERVADGRDPQLVARGEHGPAVLFEQPRPGHTVDLAMAVAGSDGRYAQVPDAPWAKALGQPTTARLAGDGVLAVWEDAQLRASVWRPGEGFGPVTTLAEAAGDTTIFADPDRPVVFWSTRAREGGTAHLQARMLRGGAWGDAVTLGSVQAAPAEAGIEHRAYFTIEGVVARGGGWTLLSQAQTDRFAEGEMYDGGLWKLEVRDGEGVAAGAARELAAGGMDTEFGGGITPGIAVDPAGGTFIHWNRSTREWQRFHTLYRPSGGELPAAPQVGPGRWWVGAVPVAGDRLYLMEWGQASGTYVGGNLVTAGALSADPATAAPSDRRFRTDFEGDGAGHALLLSGIGLRVYDEVAPQLGEVQVPATTVPGKPERFLARAGDAWTGESVRWDFGDGATAAGEEAEHAYAAPGRYTVTVTASDAAGNQTAASRVVEVVTAIPVGGAPPVLLDRTPPALARVLGSGARRGKRVSVRFSLDEPSSVLLRLQRVRKGVLRGGRCRTARAARRQGGRACVRRVTVDRLELRAGAGETVRALGKRALLAGRYRVTISARDAAGNAAKRAVVKLERR